MRNLVHSLTTYMALSPDLVTREQVNQRLRSRPALTCDEWFRHHWTPPAQPRALPKPLIDFAYQTLATCSGLDIGRVQPTDHLIDDLAFPAVCWFDWGLTLCEDFHTTFGLDISEQFDETQFVTLADLIGFLNQQLDQSAAASGEGERDSGKRA